MVNERFTYLYLIISAPSVKGTGVCGAIYVAEPVDACSALTNKAVPITNQTSSIVMITRGGCSFDDKVRRAQAAGFKAAIVYDNEDGDLVASMSFSRFFHLSFAL